jgi:hypothetical protein
MWVAGTGRMGSCNCVELWLEKRCQHGIESVVEVLIGLRKAMPQLE